MRKMESRQVEVKYCDLCDTEVEELSSCVICKREMCNKGGGSAHTAYSIELYRYRDGERIISRVCRDCVKEGFNVTIQGFFDEMFEKKGISGPFNDIAQSYFMAKWKAIYIKTLIKNGFSKEDAIANFEAGDHDFTCDPIDAANDELGYA